MLLSGWKEISRYLKCGVRTAQRWRRDLHLPVTRIRSGKRGPVMADSQSLDDWLKHRSSLVTEEAAVRRTSVVTEQTKRVGNSFLWLELETGRNFASLAKTAKHTSMIARRRQAARKAYDTLRHYVSGHTLLHKSELKEFQEELLKFRRELEQLGEVFDS